MNDLKSFYVQLIILHYNPLLCSAYCFELFLLSIFKEPLTCPLKTKAGLRMKLRPNLHHDWPENRFQANNADESQKRQQELMFVCAVCISALEANNRKCSLIFPASYLTEGHCCMRGQYSVSTNRRSCLRATLLLQ